ncbi:antitoxin [Deinococcus aerius]|uniref:Antitoxin n=1 Tax=Deinococcus aerius TaxID=200253 RepID=A0A2I9DQ10_9DEIO|nr:AbrB/MazE/SpoVT family DNA-binding domain-containing protein [Deinococcus aerius]GBF07291.1 antitoxin [Deinococcus aerius]
MTRSKVFRSGKSQVVRIPSEVQLPYGEVEIRRCGRGLVVTPVKRQDGDAIFAALTSFENPIEREQPPMQEREPLL